jgi:hypothetical protein
MNMYDCGGLKPGMWLLIQSNDSGVCHAVGCSTAIAHPRVLPSKYDANSDLVMPATAANSLHRLLGAPEITSPDTNVPIIARTGEDE